MSPHHSERMCSLFALLTLLTLVVLHVQLLLLWVLPVLSLVWVFFAVAEDGAENNPYVAGFHDRAVRSRTAVSGSAVSGAVDSEAVGTAVSRSDATDGGSEATCAGAGSNTLGSSTAWKEVPQDEHAETLFGSGAALPAPAAEAGVVCASYSSQVTSPGKIPCLFEMRKELVDEMLTVVCKRVVLLPDFGLFLDPLR